LRHRLNLRRLLLSASAPLLRGGHLDLDHLGRRLQPRLDAGARRPLAVSIGWPSRAA